MAFPCVLVHRARKAASTGAAGCSVSSLVQSPAGLLKPFPVCFPLYRNLPSASSQNTSANTYRKLGAMSLDRSVLILLSH